jgi:tRNA pseudouridine55 synthase
MFGLLNLYKPPGISSRQAINRVQHWVRPDKIGHTGTLDPLADGVLVVTVGPATRLTSHIHAWPKTYRGTFLLGCSSDTEDVLGSVNPCADAPVPEAAQLQRILDQFTGTFLQQPPSYSALKVDGQRAYNRARRGELVELAPRPVTVFELELEHYEYPELRLRAVCSTGTYIRSLGRDIARAVGTQAVMSRLTRTAVGHLTIDSAVPPELLDRETLDRYLLPAREAVRDLPVVELTQAQRQRLGHGQEIDVPGHTERELAAMTASGDLAAILLHIGPQRYRPQRNFIATQAG